VCVVVLVENLKRLKRNFEVGRSMFLKNGFKDRDWIWATQNLDVELRGDFLLYNSDFAFFLKFVRGAFNARIYIIFGPCFHDFNDF